MQTSQLSPMSGITMREEEAGSEEHILSIGRVVRRVGAITDRVQDEVNFITKYEATYGSIHPRFYQVTFQLSAWIKSKMKTSNISLVIRGTYGQALGDAKRKVTNAPIRMLSIETFFVIKISLTSLERICSSGVAPSPHPRDIGRLKLSEKIPTHS